MGQGTILVVDDERALRLMLRAMLEDMGFSVIEAADGDAALSMLREHPELRALVLDLTMPRKGGLDVLAQMQEWQIRLPTVLCSGYQDPEGAERFVARQPLAFLQKPFGMSELEASLARLLGQNDS